MTPERFSIQSAHSARQEPGGDPGLGRAMAASPSCASCALFALCAELFGAKEFRGSDNANDDSGFEPAACLGRNVGLAEGEDVVGEIVFVDHELGIARLAERESRGRAMSDSWWLSVIRSGAENDALWSTVRVGVWASARHLGRGQGELIAVFSSGPAIRPAIDFERETLAHTVDGMCFAGEADDER